MPLLGLWPKSPLASGLPKVAGLRYAGYPWGAFTPELAVGAGQTPGSAVLQRINPWLMELLRGPASGRHS